MERDPTEFPLDSATEETLSGDLRDNILTHIRSMRDPWGKLSEHAQADKVHAADQCARDIVRKVVSLVSKRGFESVSVTLGKFEVNDGVKGVFVASKEIGDVTKLTLHGSAPATLVLASAAEYFGEKAPAEIAKDQPDLIEEDDGPVFDQTAAGRG